MRVRRKDFDCLSSSPEEEEKIMKQSEFPTGWDEERVRRVLAHYEQQTEEEAIAEDVAAFEDHNETVMDVPLELVPVVRELIARHQAAG
jgi:hypothetical protein